MDVLEFIVPASLSELESATEGLTLSKERPDVAGLDAQAAEALVESALRAFKASPHRCQLTAAAPRQASRLRCPRVSRRV